MVIKSPFGDDAFPVLVGDIGGTNARFSVIENRQSEAVALPAQRTSDHHSFEDAVLASLEKSPFQPNTALLAAAGPLQHGVVDFTNSSWILDPHLTMTATGMPNCIILNDFEAQALVLPDLNPAQDCVPIGPNLQPKIASKVVLGPGTGLGVAYLLRAGDAWIPVPGEGGHVSLAPENNDELALWRILLRDRSRVSAETLLAGRGLVVLHSAMAEMFGQKSDFTRPALPHHIELVLIVFGPGCRRFCLVGCYPWRRLPVRRC
jgi:glucokinase